MNDWTLSVTGYGTIMSNTSAELALGCAQAAQSVGQQIELRYKGEVVSLADVLATRR